jgi:hypothetical protein
MEFEMAKKPMSDAQKYRRANARGAGPGAEGRAKIKAAEKIAADPKKAEKAGEGAIYGLRTAGASKLGEDYARKIGGNGQPGYYKKGGKVESKEGTAKDMREDKAMAKKRGMSMKDWEKSAADKKHDAPKKMAKGGSVRGTGAAIRGKGFSGTY